LPQTLNYSIVFGTCQFVLLFWTVGWAGVHITEVVQILDIETQGVEFLRELLALVHKQPDITCAGILEHWRDSKYENRLKELSIKDNLLTEPEELKIKFMEIIEKIAHDYQQQLRDTRVQNIQNLDDLRNMYPSPASSSEE